MNNLKPVFIVQSMYSSMFLFPDVCGDVGLTPFLHLAGRFESKEEAMMTGFEQFGEDFVVVEFYEAL